MKPVLLLYATRERQTRRIAEHLADSLAARRVSFQLVDAACVPPGFSMADYCAAIVSASVHLGKHESEMKKFVQRHLLALEQMPTTFLSVSLSEARVEDTKAAPERREKAQADVRHVIETFLASTGWHPTHVNAVAGALAYRKYNFAVRILMKNVARHVGAPTDTSRNHEFTDWAGLDALVDQFLQSVSLRSPAAV